MAFPYPGFPLTFLPGQFELCVKYFVNIAQHTAPIQTLAAFLNIKLPYQFSHSPIPHYNVSSPSSASRVASPSSGSTFLSLLPYIRRLVATGFDVDPVLHGFFGDHWPAGVGPLREAERCNFLFAAKSDSWLQVKEQYDMDEGQTIPFLRPLRNVQDGEISGAEQYWSEWLAMQDWMLGSRAPTGGSFIKTEED